MNLFRFLLLAAAIYLIVRLIRASRASITRKSAPPPPSRPEQSYEPMGRCARCGTHLPQSALSRAQLCGRCSD